MKAAAREVQPIRFMDIQELLKNSSSEDLERLNVAYVYAAKKHFGQLRQSGEPYLSHPLSVAYILAEMNMDMDSIIAGMLHDTVEDTDATQEDLEQIFGKDITFLVDGMTKISNIEFSSKEEKQAENFRKMLISMSEDIRVILIKLADRLHNMRTIDSLRPDKQKRIAKETLEIYAPLAHRLGIAWIKWELEDLCFRVLNREMYVDIQQKVKLNRSEREDYLNRVVDIVSKATLAEGISAEVNGRPKHFYSIYNKMKKKQSTFDEIYDLLALRVLVDTVSQCYASLGVLHNLFKPIPARFKDYIAMPKPNMYQSLHTTVIGPEGQMVEFQIRTRQMHHVAEEGIAAHWKYKEGKAFDPKNDTQFVWLRQLLESQSKSEEMVETLKDEVLQMQIYVFTPQGDVVELPEGSTPIDFAYAIHSEVGNRCVGAKANGRIVHLKYRLQNGDKVEVITNPTQEPRKDWLKFVKTSRAKSRIRAYLRKKDTDKALAYAVYILDKKLREHNSSYKEIFEDQQQLKKILDKSNERNLDELLAAVGFGRLSPQKVVHIVFPAPEREEEDSTHVSKSQANGQPFHIEGVDNMMIKVARCCTPLPGDDVIGYISSGRGIVVHKKSCPNVTNPAISSDRLIPVEWDADRQYLAPVKLLASTISMPGLINNITAVVKDMGLNIIEYSAKAVGGGESEQRISIELSNKDQLESLMNKIRQVRGVKSLRQIT